MHVRRALKDVNGRLELGPTKTHAQRTVSLPGFLKEMLREHLLASGGGRDLPAAHTLYPVCGYATFVMDTRAQGGTWSAGDTPDPGAGSSSAEHPGVMTRGIASPETYYYRRLYVDAVSAVETAAALPGVDADRIIVAGTSQGEDDRG